MEISPHKIAENIVKMADEYGKLGERYNELKGLYALWWATSRGEFKSDKSTEKAWDLTCIKLAHIRQGFTSPATEL